MRARSILTPLLLAVIASPVAFGGADTTGQDSTRASGSGNGKQASESKVGATGAFSDQVTMTWVSGETRFATIDGGFYRTGEHLADGGVVVDIRPGGVLIERDGERQWVAIVDEPPPLDSPYADAELPLTPLSYLDEAIARLTLEIEGLAGDPSRAQRAAELEALRSRLQSGRDALASGQLDPEIETELSEDWLLAQQQLEALRERTSKSPGGLGMEELRATQGLLEQALLSTLREPLARLQDPEFQMQATAQSSDLLHSVGALLSSYPDYKALADRLQGAGQSQ